MRSARNPRIRLDHGAPLRGLSRLGRPAVLIRLAAVVAVGALVAGPATAAGRRVASPGPSRVLAADPVPTQSLQTGTLDPSTPVGPPRPSRSAVRPVDVSVQWSGAGALGIPTIVLEAYQHAAALTAVSDPACNLGWWVLAGIGHAESDQAEGGRVDAHGTTLGRILGPRLDGHLAGNAVIRDTDHGALDGDPLYDRAVGPLQFIPSTWRLWGVDGNGDGIADPNNVFDAALTTAHYLCAGGRNLATPAGLRAAILSYNASTEYLAGVLAWAQAYRIGAFAVADSAAPVVTDVTTARPPLTARPPVILVPRTSSSSSGAAVPTPRPGGPVPASSTAAPQTSRTAPPSGGCAPAPSATASSSAAAPTGTSPASTPSQRASTTTSAAASPSTTTGATSTAAPSPTARCS